MPASLITVADVIRGVEGPFSAGGDVAAAPSGGIGEVWAALRASERAVLESVTLADLAAGSLPEGIRSRTA
jgi:DNA-binding IscR family transcriptional regulator